MSPEVKALLLRIDDLYVVRLSDGGEVISERWFASKKKAINHYRKHKLQK